MGSEDTPDLPSFFLGTKRRKSGLARPASRLPSPAAPSLFDSLFDLGSVAASAIETESAVQADIVLPAVVPTTPQPVAKAPARAGPQPTSSHLPTREELSQAPASPAAQVWSVTALVRAVRGLVERDYSRVTVEGEISNWRPAGSGHCYFTLKDGDAQLSSVMFRRSASLLRFRPKDGDSVRLRGQLSVYENRGQMQIIAESMEIAGQGALLAAVQALKERLRREGLFERKRPLPAFPKCIGVVTSLQGAALRDIVKVCRRRHAAINLLVYPAAVQGPDCARQIMAGLRWFSQHKDRADVVIVARGGGSWEDLHGFDDEGVARAIAACELPVISGIGHATDTTIADAAADVCAPTPSAAAELVTAAHHRVEERVERLRARVLRAGRYEMLRVRQRLLSIGAENILRRAADAVRRREQRLDELSSRAETAAEHALRTRQARMERLEQRLRRQEIPIRLSSNKQRLQSLQFRLHTTGASVIASRMQQAERCASRLEALSPLRVLERGYALVYGPDGALLRNTKAVTPGDTLAVRVSQGSLHATVIESDAVR